MGAVAAVAGARAAVPLQLPRARSRSHPVHERLRQERLCLHQSGDGWLRDGDCRCALRIPRGICRGLRVLDHPDLADLDARLSVVEVLDGALSRAGLHGGADHRGEPTIGRRSVPEAGGGGPACGPGPRYPRFNADATQAAGSYGGVMFMIAAVALIIVSIVFVGWPSSMYLMAQTGRFSYRLTPERYVMIVASFSAA